MSQIIHASPKVRKFARQLGADISQLKGSERNGRITENDVRNFIKNQIKKQENTPKKSIKDEKKKLLQLRKYIENNFEYVGKDFSKKVREVYYDNKSKKTFYGTTTPEEREELANEGIDLLSIPWINKDN